MPTHKDLCLWTDVRGKAQHVGFNSQDFPIYEMFPPFEGRMFVEEGTETGYLYGVDGGNTLEPYVTLEDIGYVKI